MLQLPSHDENVLFVLCAYSLGCFVLYFSLLVCRYIFQSHRRCQHRVNPPRPRVSDQETLRVKTSQKNSLNAPTTRYCSGYGPIQPNSPCCCDTNSSSSGVRGWATTSKGWATTFERREDSFFGCGFTSVVLASSRGGVVSEVSPTVVAVVTRHPCVVLHTGWTSLD